MFYYRDFNGKHKLRDLCTFINTVLVNIVLAKLNLLFVDLPYNSPRCVPALSLGNTIRTLLPPAE